MAVDEESGDFNEARADIFEAISHPARIKILQTLSERPMGFAELGRAVGIEGGGHLSFHLRKLAHLVKTSADGNYALTGDGKEALWSINSLRKTSNGTTAKAGEASVRHRTWTRPVLGGLVIALIAFGAVAVYQQQQLSQQGAQIASQQAQISKLNLPSGHTLFSFQGGSNMTIVKTRGAPTSVAVGPDGSIYYASLEEADKCHVNDSISRITSSGTRLVINDSHAISMAVDMSGTLYWLDFGGCGGSPGIFKLGQADSKPTLILPLPECENLFYSDSGCSLAVDSGGTLYFTKNATIFKLPSGSSLLQTVYQGSQSIVDLAVHNGLFVYSTREGNVSWLGPPYTNPSSDWPFGPGYPTGFISHIAISPSGQVYFLDALGTVYRIGPGEPQYHIYPTVVYQVCQGIPAGSNCFASGLSIGNGEVVAADYVEGTLTVYSGVGI